jgi:flagellar motor switch protein FliN
MADEQVKEAQTQSEESPTVADAEVAPTAAADPSPQTDPSEITEAPENTPGDTPDSPSDTETDLDPTPPQELPTASEPEAQVPPLPDFSNMLADAAAGSIEMLNDVDLNVKVELGRAQLTVDEILRLTDGYVVELDKLAGDPVDILANEQLIARGEVLVVNDSFCVRINEIIPSNSEKAAQNMT